jgi:hypothetical protein
MRMPFDDRLDAAARAGDEAGVRRLLAGAGRAKLAELALTQRLPDWLKVLVRQEREQREQKATAAAACPTSRRKAGAEAQLRPFRKPSLSYRPSSCAVLEPEPPGSPSWLGWLAGIVEAALSVPARTDKPGFRCRVSEGRWEVLVSLAPAETGAAFSLDLRRLQAAFHRVDAVRWNAGGTGDEGPGVCIEGLFRGHEVHLRVLACSARDEAPIQH